MAQKWLLVKNSDGTYSFKSKLNEKLYLDIANGSSNNCTNVQVYEGNGSNAQKFRLVLQYNFEKSEQVEQDTYNILSASNPKRGLDLENNNRNSGANIQIWDNTNNPAQKFELIYNNDNTYTIKVASSGKVLDVENGKMTNWTNVWQYEPNNTKAQKWFLIKNDDETYSFISKLNGLALDISGGKINNGANVQVYEYNNSQAQKFILKKAYPITGSQSVENGVYEISTLLNESKSIQLKSASKNNNIPIQLNESANSEQQKFDLEYTGDGYYKIKAKLSGKVLTVENSNPKSGSKIVQKTDENLDTQKWIFSSCGTNLYYIYSKCGNLCIDVPGGNANNGTNLQLYKENGTNSQKFILIKREVEGKQTLKDGIYKIKLKNNKSFDISNGSCNNYANLQTWDNSNVQQQKFRIKYNNDGTYTISAIHSKKSIDVQNGGTKINTNVCQYELNNTINQKWILNDLGNGYYNIISKANGLYIDVQGGLSNNNGTNIQLYYNNGSDAQKFKFTPTNIIDEGTYQISSTINTNRVFDISGGSKDNFANLQLWNWDYVEQQYFNVKVNSNNEYTIIAKHSNKAIDVQNGGTKPGTNVAQYEQNGTINQKWLIEEAGNNSYKIISKANGLCMDAENAVANNGTNIQLYTPNDSSAQKFKFEKKKVTIVLNAGHGGSETGCANNRKGLVEKNVTLQIARYLKDELSKYKDANVILTRDGDYDMRLEDRAMVARNNNADLYVSLHINDEASHTTTGSQMYIPFYEGKRQYNSKMNKLANYVQDELSNIGIGRNIWGGIVKRNIDALPKYQYLLNGQVVQADYYSDIRSAMKGDTLDYGPDLNTETGVPTILIEHCFMNSNDSNYLDSDSDLRNVAKADARGIVKYFGLK